MKRYFDCLREHLAFGAAVTLGAAVFAAGAASMAPLPAGTGMPGASLPSPHGAATPAQSAPLPQRLSDTGLYVAGSTTEVRPENLPFTPQYPLWSDGATKRRWLYLPPGTAIDASRPNAWQFPPGTRLWKEFSYERRVETRLIERLADGTWRYAAYVWNEDGSDAVLAPTAGVRALATPGAPNGRYTVPSEADCRACHEGGATPVLGFSALQLSPDRDPLAPHAELSGAERRRPAPPRRARQAARLAAGAARHAAAHRRRDADRTCRARLPARQLRALPQPRRRGGRPGQPGCARCRST